MPDYKTKYTNKQGKVIPALADIKYKAPSDTIVYLSPQVPGAKYHKIVLSGPNSKYYQFENADGTFYRNEEYEDYYIPRAREAVKNAQPRSFGEKLKYGIKNLFSFEQGGHLNKYQLGGDIPRRENYGLMNDGNMVYADSPDLSLPKPKQKLPVFDPNAGRQEAYDQQWKAHKEKLAQEVINGSARRINMRREQRRFQRNFDQTWDDQELSRKASFDIANGPGGQLKPTPVEVPQKTVTTATYFDSPSPTAAPSNEAAGQKLINNQIDDRIAAENAQFKQARKDAYWLKQAQKFGDFKTLEEVKQWQAKYGLDPDGKFGSKSEEIFNKINEAKRIRNEIFNASNDLSNQNRQWYVLDEIRKQINPTNPESVPLSYIRHHPSIPAYEEISHNIKFPEDIVERYRLQHMMRDLISDTDPDIRNIDELNQILNFPVTFKKQGGIMNKYQQGGAVPQQDIQQQVKQLVQAAVVQKNPEAVKQIKQIIEAAQQGDEQAIQIATLIQKEMESVQKAQKGAKLNYIKSLKGDCPDGEEVVYFKKGGMLCKTCEKKKMKAEQGKKLNAIEEFKKGRKCKK